MYETLLFVAVILLYLIPTFLLSKVNDRRRFVFKVIISVIFLSWLIFFEDVKTMIIIIFISVIISGLYIDFSKLQKNHQ